MRAFLVDTLAAILFFTLVAMFTEIVIAGLSLGQSLTVRVSSIPLMLTTGRPYGRWRDAIFRRTRAGERGPLAVAALDTAAFMTFNVPVYALVLLMVGADGQQLALAIVSAGVAMLLTSRPYGLFLDAFRRRLGVAPAS